MSYFNNINLATNDLGRDAWGRPKVIIDHTLFSGMWSFNVPNRQWIGYIKDPLETSWDEEFFIPTDNSGDYFYSENGYLTVISKNGKDVCLRSKRHIRYQPNKGYLYSTAVILPEPNEIGIREWGQSSLQSGVFFRLSGTGSDWKLYACRMTHFSGVTTTIAEDITDLLPDGFDISKGHVYDIQMQWRGVGDFFFYIDLTLIYRMEMLGTLTAMSVNNPALHTTWKCCSGSTQPIIAGCVDVTSEGGHVSNKLYSSINTGHDYINVTRTNDGTGVIGVLSPRFITYNNETVEYSRDMLLAALSAFSLDEYLISVWMGRCVNTPNLSALTWDTASDTFYEYLINSNATNALDDAFQLDKSNMQNIFSIRHEKDQVLRVTPPLVNDMSFTISTGDIMIINIEPQGTASTAGCTLEFAEEV